MTMEKTSGQKIFSSSAKMAIATFSSRILGLVREQAIAAAFGASGVTDAFTVAYRIPNMLRDLFAEGAFSSAFVPIFTEEKLKDEKSAKALMWSVLILLLLVTLLISGLIIIFSPEIVTLLTSEKFHSDPERFRITVTLTQMMAPFLSLVSLAALFMGVLNSLKIFFVPSFAPAFFNIIMIVCIFFGPKLLIERSLHPVYSLGIGVMLGGLVQMLVQIPLVLKNGYGPTGPIKLLSHQSKRILNRVSIGMVGIAANQINIIVTTILATSTLIGAVSWMTYAFRLFQFPVGILSVSLAGSNLVHFSDAWKSGKEDEARSVLQSSYSMSWFVVLPALAMLFALAGPSVNLVFEHGAFDAEDTRMTTMALQYYLVGLPFYGLYKIFSPTFFSLDRPKVPVIISLTTIGLNIIFCVIFTPIYGFKILPLGTSLSMMLNCLLQSIMLKKYLKLDLSFFFNLTLVKYLVASVIMAGLGYLASQQFYRYDGGFLLKAIIFCAICLSMLLIYVFSLLVMGEKKSFANLSR